MSFEGRKIEADKKAGKDVEISRDEIDPNKHFLVKDGKLLPINMKMNLGSDETRYRFGENEIRTLTGDETIELRELP